jgi:alpha-2-macroglobulin
MKRIFILICFLIPLTCFAQQNLKDIRKKSWQTFVYRIPASDAIEYERSNTIPIDKFLTATSFGTFSKDSFFEADLPNGHYVFLSVIDNELIAVLYNKSDLLLLAVNNKQQLQLAIRSTAGNPVLASAVFINGKKALPNAVSQTYLVKQKSFEEATVVVCAAGDTLITTVSALDDLRITVSEQKRNNWRNSKTYKIINWIPQNLSSLHNKKIDSKRINASGFIIFNQPKYKPLDTLKFKGYVVGKDWKTYNKPVQVYLEYVARGKYYSQFIKQITPVSYGAYVNEFVIADSIPSETRCKLIFKTTSGKQIISENFNVEDYVLDEIGSQQFRSEKETYFRNDTLRFYAAAKDANGLRVMDATARLILTTTAINHFYKDTCFVPDTLFNNEVKLLTDIDTKFVVATSTFANADLVIEAKLVFKNANNELQEKSTTVSYLYQSKKMFLKQEKDSIKAVYIENGKEKKGIGEMSMNYGKDIVISYPLAVKIDPVAEDYYFYLYDGNDTLKEVISIKDNYQVSLSRISQGDTLGFVLENPYKIPVYFTVFNGKEVIVSGRQSDELISWIKFMKDRRQMYKVKWQYHWAGEEKSGEENIGLLYKLLNIKIENDPTVFPGQKDSIKINVTDYLGRPTAGVNLTAVSYNNQFKSAMVKDPPYLVKYKSKKYIERDGFEANEPDETIFTKKYSLGKYAGWMSKFGLDTMEYYKLLFPPDKYHDAVRPIIGLLPQISVNVVDKGVPQEIYLLYINRQLAYYNGVTGGMNYAYEVFPENVQLGIRLRNKFIEIDSLYLQPFYKHDLSFDVNNLPKNASVKITDTVWHDNEKSLLEKTMWQMQHTSGNIAYVWQNRSVFQLSRLTEHVAGPFTANQKLTFFRPGSFNLDFLFEPGYQYQLAPGILRLEKKAMFPRKDIKYVLPVKKGTILLGDTVENVPTIKYDVIFKQPELTLSPQNNLFYRNYRFKDKGNILLITPKDTVIRYCLLKQVDSVPVILDGYFKNLYNISPGNYQLILVTESMGAYSSGNFEVKPYGTVCLNLRDVSYKTNHALIEKILKEQAITKEKKIENEVIIKQRQIIYTIPDSVFYLRNGGGIIRGWIKDSKGSKPIPYCVVTFKNASKGVVSDVNGQFEMSRVRPGKYILLISQVGYSSKEIEINVVQNEVTPLQLLLEINDNNLSEVVVVGYGMQRKASITGSIATITGKDLTAYNINTSLAGKAPGVQINPSSGVPGSSTLIRLRGENSMNSDNSPLVVVDGIIYTSMQDISPEMVMDITILQGAEATALYGSRGSNGVIVITTKTKTDRKDFRDYAFWVPNFFTDKNGKASIEVVYPDNITAWKTFVVAMDKKRRMGKASVLTKAFKPMLAQLNLPLFLIEGDSSYFVTKSINYTADKYDVKTTFSINDIVLSEKEKELPPNDASVTKELVFVAGIDTVMAAFGIKSTSGFKDKEERKIPVFEKGIQETVGNFWILQSDSVVHFKARPGVTGITIFAQNNTLDVMLEELENLKRYPFYCMEQLCSKITGLLLERNIKEQLKQPFKGQSELQMFLKRIQKAQQFDGGWAWWENGKSNVYISNYVVNALLKNPENPLLQATIRNAFLYLQNRLPYLDKNELLASLTTLSNGKHQMNYQVWLEKIHFDSIAQHQQWQLVKIKQQQELQYQTALDSLINKQTATMLGGIHWGVENYRWYSNEVATTVLAFEVLSKEEKHQKLLPSIIQYFLEKKRNGYWQNTVETATILNTILPNLLKARGDFPSAGRLSITGDTSFMISSFPYHVKLNNPSFKNLSVTTQGGGMIYFTANQSFFNKNPKALEDNFIVQTLFKKNDQVISKIKTGERIKMIIRVEVLKDAEYVMLNVPIPAGCIFTNKTNNDWHIFKEYQKDKLILFAEALNKGMHEFVVELEPRYTGSYNLNPSKIELMYYPTFYGRNYGRKMVIE